MSEISVEKYTRKKPDSSDDGSNFYPEYLAFAFSLSLIITSYTSIYKVSKYQGLIGIVLFLAVSAYYSVSYLREKCGNSFSDSRYNIYSQIIHLIFGVLIILYTSEVVDALFVTIFASQIVLISVLIGKMYVVEVRRDLVPSYIKRLENHRE